jgi:hypothetical protein
MKMNMTHLVSGLGPAEVRQEGQARQAVVLPGTPFEARALLMLAL